MASATPLPFVSMSADTRPRARVQNEPSWLHSASPPPHTEPPTDVQVTDGSGNTTFTTFQNGNGFGASTYGAGNAAYYTFWYRDTGNTCSGQGFNFTNAWCVVWNL